MLRDKQYNPVKRYQQNTYDYRCQAIMPNVYETGREKNWMHIPQFHLLKIAPLLQDDLSFLRDLSASTR